MPLSSIPRHPTPKPWQSARGRLRSDLVSGVIWRRGCGILETRALPRWHTHLCCARGKFPSCPCTWQSTARGIRGTDALPQHGDRDFTLNHCCTLAEGARHLRCKWLPVFYALPWFAPAQTRSLLLSPACACVWHGACGSSTAQRARQRERSSSAPATSLCGWLRAPFPALTHSIPSPGLPGCGRRGPAAW